MLRFTKTDKELYLKTIEKYFKIDRREISFLKFIFEAYDGIGVLTTIDAKSGIIVLKIPPGCEADADALIEDMKKDITIEPVYAFEKTGTEEL